jgi:ParB-like chromosome segregation protein Spo0J
MKIRDRIRELRRVQASDLVPHPGNWRVHGKAQTAALKGLLAEIGYADALLARELPDGNLLLIDGHLRRDSTPNQEVPVLILDVTEAEANKILLTLDPLAGMARQIRLRSTNYLRRLRRRARR